MGFQRIILKGLLFVALLAEIWYAFVGSVVHALGYALSVAVAMEAMNWWQRRRSSSTARS